MPRPSTRKRIAVRIATMEATTATAVSNAIRALGGRSRRGGPVSAREHGAETEHEDEHELADQPRAIPLRRTSFHIPLFGSDAAADKRCMESILIADDHPLTREALASLLEQHGFDVVGQASDGEEAIVEAGRLRRARPARPDDARNGWPRGATAYS